MHFKQILSLVFYIQHLDSEQLRGARGRMSERTVPGMERRGLQSHTAGEGLRCARGSEHGFSGRRCAARNPAWRCREKYPDAAVQSQVRVIRIQSLE